APAGSVVILYATGLGRTSPEGRDGHIAATPLPDPIVPLTVDPPFTLAYAGDAPGIVEGVTQINLQLPRTPVSGTYVLRAATLR
ncbi:MAG: hypothetical protein JWP63_2015, partial [Candidatus Solibacter sp.]|nr:hypothetical protein [Candidatus Solibacter sp.]